MELEPIAAYGAFSRELDAIRHVARNGVEFWMARELQGILRYQRWEDFQKIIGKALAACEGAGAAPRNHFRQTPKMINVGKGAQRETVDWFLSRYACYLIAMNGDSGKPEIAFAQAYFAVQARKQEMLEQLLSTEKRIELRGRVSTAVKALNMVAKEAGVLRYDVFHNAGYRGLYGMFLADIKRHKNIPQDEDLLDRSGRAELAANEFRLTQAEQKITRERITGQNRVTQAHYEVGTEVRQAIAKTGRVMPEDMPPEPSIKKLMASRRAKALPER
jgi:DNA-damage-inducible protein D